MRQQHLTQDLQQKILINLLKDFIKYIQKLWVLLIYKEINQKFKMLNQKPPIIKVKIKNKFMLIWHKVSLSMFNKINDDLISICYININNYSI